MVVIKSHAEFESHLGAIALNYFMLSRALEN